MGDADAGALDADGLVADLHAVEAFDGHVGGGGVEVFAEGNALEDAFSKGRERRGGKAKKTYSRLFGAAVFDQHESFELAEGFEELGDLVVREEGGDVGDADFAGGVGDGGGDDAFHGFGLFLGGGRDDVVFWSTHREAFGSAVGGAVFEFDVVGFVHAEAVESEGDGGIGGGFELD